MYFVLRNYATNLLALGVEISQQGVLKKRQNQCFGVLGIIWEGQELDRGAIGDQGGLLKNEKIPHTQNMVFDTKIKTLSSMLRS